MRLVVNGEDFQYTPASPASESSVRHLLEHLQLAGRPVAVERNGQIVPHATFDQTSIVEGDVLEIVTLVGGG